MGKIGNKIKLGVAVEPWINEEILAKVPNKASFIEEASIKLWNEKYKTIYSKMKNGDLSLLSPDRILISLLDSSRIIPFSVLGWATSTISSLPGMSVFSPIVFTSRYQKVFIQKLTINRYYVRLIREYSVLFDRLFFPYSSPLGNTTVTSAVPNSSPGIGVFLDCTGIPGMQEVMV